MTEPIAILGAGCRIPGSGDSLAALGDLLERGEQRVAAAPAERLGSASLVAGAVAGAFLERIHDFDPEAFGLSAREVERMDPRQRLLLEVCVEALEDAGWTPELGGRRVGVYVGAAGDDHRELQHAHPETLDELSGTGGAANMLAGRVSHTLDLTGPALTVDTACSSSLAAVHLACQGLWAGDCDLAVAGGVHLMLSPYAVEAVARMGLLSPTGRCRPFDAAADGIALGEGCGMVVLARAGAVGDGDRVLATIVGSALGQDGHTLALTAPNGPMQERVIRDAWSRAGVDTGKIDYLEAHGTGTPLGDPIEAGALANVLAGRRSPCPVGSVKANFGHLAAAAGIAGVLKVLAAFERERLPPHPCFSAWNPEIPAGAAVRVPAIRVPAIRVPAIRVPVTAEPWPRDHRRFAGVSSFGWSGTNAHLALADPPAPAERPEVAEGVARVVPLSAHDAGALAELARRWRRWLTGDGLTGDGLTGDGAGARLADLAYTAGVRRRHHRHRAAVVAATREELAEGLARVRPKRAAAPGSPRIAFLFSGQGSAWPAMGRDLMAAEERFRDAVEACDRAFADAGLGGSVAAELAAGEVAAERWQPALFALQLGVARCLRGWGVEPVAVVGHSLGEVAAAVDAGCLDLAAGCRVVAARWRLTRGLHGAGAMASVDLPAKAVAAGLEGFPEVEIAATNAADATVVTAPSAALERWLEKLAESGVTARRVDTDVAWHSAAVEEAAGELARVLDDLAPAAGTVPFFSSVAGAEVAGTDLDGGYWGRNLRRRVRFHQALEALLDRGVDALVEVAAHPIVGGAAERVARRAGAALTVVPTLHRDRPADRALATAVARLYGAGTAVRWDALGGRGAAVVSLPTYPWQRRHLPPPYVTAVHGEAPEPAGEAPPEAAGDRGLLRRRVAGLAPPAAREVLLEAVREEVAEVLGEAPAAVPLDDGLFQLGLTSLGAVQVGHRLGELTAAELPRTLGFEHPTVRRVARFLALEVLGLDDDGGWGAGEAAEPLAGAPGPEELADDDLSEEEMAKLLDERISSVLEKL